MFTKGGTEHSSRQDIYNIPTTNIKKFSNKIKELHSKIKNFELAIDTQLDKIIVYKVEGSNPYNIPRERLSKILDKEFYFKKLEDYLNTIAKLDNCLKYIDNLTNYLNEINNKSWNLIQSNIINVKLKKIIDEETNILYSDEYLNNINLRLKLESSPSETQILLEDLKDFLKDKTIDDKISYIKIIREPIRVTVDENSTRENIHEIETKETTYLNFPKINELLNFKKICFSSVDCSEENECIDLTSFYGRCVSKRERETIDLGEFFNSTESEKSVVEDIYSITKNKNPDYDNTEISYYSEKTKIVNVHLYGEAKIIDNKLSINSVNDVVNFYQYLIAFIKYRLDEFVIRIFNEQNINLKSTIPKKERKLE